MQVIKTHIDGVLLLEPKVWSDNRGCFFECFHRDRFLAAGIPSDYVQDNHSQSRYGVLRGLHFQKPPHAQDKLVRADSGEIFDVAVDIRPNSPTFGRWVGFYLSGTNQRMLLVPHGCAHGFCVISAAAEVTYKCSDFYAPECEGTIRWNDPDLGIQWPVSAPVLSGKDAAAPLLHEIFACELSH